MGYAEGPQVPHPLAPEYEGGPRRARPVLAGRCSTRGGAEGREWFTLTPEFGPPDYMPCLPFTRQPVADAWDVNVEFLDYLRATLEG